MNEQTINGWRFWMYWDPRDSQWNCEGSSLAFRKVILTHSLPTDSDPIVAALDRCQTIIASFMESLPKE